MCNKHNMYKEELERLKRNYVAFIKAENQQLAKWIENNEMEKFIGDDLRFAYGAFSAFMRKSQYTNTKEHRALQGMLGKPIREQHQEQEQEQEQKIRRKL
ncbi:hypothetical protein GO491_10745 [Flavobacteriaceae bacterium Ap0902]|nr:hypothetical protein [Flavobacteriaceae bacterium Ap0902]